MDFVTDEFILARTGEVLEARLRESEKFQQQMKYLHEASKAFSKDSGMSEKYWKLYDRLEDEWTKYNILYGEESYRLGFEDGACAEIRLRGEDETYECLTDILDNSGIAPEERAKMLTDYGDV